MRALWLLEDSNNPRYKGYLRLFSLCYDRVDIIGITRSSPFKNVFIQTREKSQLSMLRLLFLVSKSINSRTDKYFNKRNVYSAKGLKSFVNIFWILKRNIFNQLLPNYSDLVLKLLSFQSAKVEHVGLHSYDAIICDSVWMRNSSYISLINQAKQLGKHIDVYVSSWDNIYYTQFIDFGNRYFFWSEKMQAECRDLHGIQHYYNSVLTGPVLFENFRKGLRTQCDKSTVLYAMAFADHYMLKFELQFLMFLASGLNKIGWKLLIRPYPTIEQEKLKELAQCPNIDIYEIKAKMVNRYDNDSESIKFSSDEEKMRFLGLGSIFLSLATSFTIEAAFSGIPTIHYYFENYENALHRELRERLKISDHILEYFDKNLYSVNSLDEFISAVQNIEAVKRDVMSGMEKLLANLGHR